MNGKDLKELRLTRGLSITDVSKAVGISISALCDYEHDRSFPTYHTLEKLLKYYHTFTDAYIVDDKDYVYIGDFSEIGKQKIYAIIAEELKKLY